MTIRTHPNIVSQKRQLKYERCTKEGHLIKPCPLNFEMQKVHLSGTVLDREKQNIV